MSALRAPFSRKPVPLCKDCRFCERLVHGTVCTHHLSTMTLNKNRFIPFARKLGTACGQSGRLFEPKETEK